MSIRSKGKKGKNGANGAKNLSDYVENRDHGTDMKRLPPKAAEVRRTGKRCNAACKSCPNLAAAQRMTSENSSDAASMILFSLIVSGFTESSVRIGSVTEKVEP